MEEAAGLSDEWFTALVAIISTIVGGLVSFLATFWVSLSDRRHQTKVRRDEKLEDQVMAAHSAFVKLMRCLNSIYSVDRAIDGEFKRAHADGVTGLEPANFVREMIVFDERFDPLVSSELSFLLHSSDAVLLSDLLVFEKRSEMHNAVVKTYNTKRGELSAYLVTLLDENLDADGSIQPSKLNKAQKARVDAEIGGLNQILAQSIELLERDVIEGKQLLRRFLTAAKVEFGSLFPDLKLEDDDANS
jgi:hypothetical protein